MFYIYYYFCGFLKKGFSVGKKINVSRYFYLLYVYLYNIIYKNI